MNYKLAIFVESLCNADAATAASATSIASVLAADYTWCSKEQCQALRDVLVQIADHSKDENGAIDRKVWNRRASAVRVALRRCGLLFKSSQDFLKDTQSGTVPASPTIERLIKEPTPVLVAAADATNAANTAFASTQAAEIEAFEPTGEPQSEPQSEPQGEPQGEPLFTPQRVFSGNDVEEFLAWKAAKKAAKELRDSLAAQCAADALAWQRAAEWQRAQYRKRVGWAVAHGAEFNLACNAVPAVYRGKRTASKR